MQIRLKSGIAVERTAEVFVIHGPLCTIDLPTAWVKADPAFRKLFGLRGPAAGKRSWSKESRGLFTLMAKTGCLSVEPGEGAVPFTSFRMLLECSASSWYAAYYAHPMWESLRSGGLSRNGLVTWLIHNYHISRAAGITDARSACRLSNLHARAFFRANALEEFWHCDAFYFVRHPNLRLDDRDVKDYVPLPASLAFEQQALRTAEDDWIANVSIAYFQEWSIRFYDDCLRFYKDVELHYDIPGFFAKWVQHMGLDFEHDHAGVLADQLETGADVPKAQLMESYRHTVAAKDFLMRCLDEVQSESRRSQEVLLRRPIRNGRIDPGDNALARSLDINTVHVVEGATLGDVHRSAALCVDPVVRTWQARPLTKDDAQLLQAEIVQCFYRSLGQSTEHDDAICSGQLAQRGRDAVEPYLRKHARLPAPRALWTLAVANFLRESCARPQEFLFLCLHAAWICRIVERSPDWLPLDPTALHLLQTYCNRRPVDAPTLDRLVTRMLQLTELVRVWCATRDESFDSRFP